MINRRWFSQRLAILSLSALAFGGALAMETPVFAEGYVAGFAGWQIPQKLDNGNLTQPLGTTPAGAGISDASLSQSLVYGGKAGYYFNSARWLGFEGEIYTSTPNLKQQSVTVGGKPIGTLDGSDFRVIAYGANVMLRVPGERLQPYVGIGPALFQGILHNIPGQSNNDTSVKMGLNAEAGMRFQFSKNLFAFGEYKFNYTRFHFESVAYDYKAHNLIAGIGFSF